MRPVSVHTMLLFALSAHGGCEGTGEGGGASPVAAPASVGERAPKQMVVTAVSDDKLGTQEPGLGLPVGNAAPDVLAAVDRQGKSLSIRELWSERPLLLVFYRGGWCPFCNFQIRELVESVGAFSSRGVQLAAISADQPAKAAETAEHYAIPFPVLSDPDLTVHRAFHVVHQADDAETERLKSFGLDIERASGRKHHAFAVPSIFVIGGDGVVRWAHVSADYKVRPSAQQLLRMLDALGLPRDGTSPK